MTPTSRKLPSSKSPGSHPSNKSQGSLPSFTPEHSEHPAAVIVSEIIEQVEFEISSKADTILPELINQRNPNESTNTLDDSLHTNDLGDPINETIPASLN